MRKVRKALRSIYRSVKQFFHIYSIDCAECGGDNPWSITGGANLGCCSKLCADRHLNRILEETHVHRVEDSECKHNGFYRNKDGSFTKVSVYDTQH
jgi:hypothetical protein